MLDSVDAPAVEGDAGGTTSLAGDMVQPFDPESLLPGEDPTSTEPADGVRWLRVYRDLIELTSVLLARTESALTSMGGDAVREAAIDQRLLRLQRDRYVSRHEFWARRVEASGH